MIWNADTDRLFVAVKDFRDLGAGFEDKSKGPWKGFLHHLEYGFVDHPGILGDVAKVGADKGEVVFLGIDAFDLADALDSPLVRNITAHPVHRICGVNDHPSIPEHVHHLLHTSGIGIFFIKPDKLSHSLQRSLMLQAYPNFFANPEQWEYLLQPSPPKKVNPCPARLPGYAPKG